MTEVTTREADARTDLDSLGPVDYVIVEFPAAASNFSGEMVGRLSAE